MAITREHLHSEQGVTAVVGSPCPAIRAYAPALPAPAVCVYRVPSLPSPPFPSSHRAHWSSAGQTGVFQPCYCPAPLQPGLFGGNKREKFPSSHCVFGLCLPQLTPETKAWQGEGHLQQQGSGAAHPAEARQPGHIRFCHAVLVAALRGPSGLARRQAEASGVRLM